MPSVNTATTAEVDRVLDHAAEIDAAVKFVEWLEETAVLNTMFTRVDLERLAKTCFCGTPSAR